MNNIKIYWINLDEGFISQKKRKNGKRIFKA